jgi:hypothetical protein
MKTHGNKEKQNPSLAEKAFPRIRKDEELLPFTNVKCSDKKGLIW